MAHKPPLDPPRPDGDDRFFAALMLFLFYLLCMGASAYLYWHGTGKMPWA